MADRRGAAPVTAATWATPARRRLAVAIALCSVGIASALAATVESPKVHPMPPYPRVDCGGAAKLVVEAAREHRQGPIVVLSAQSHRMLTDGDGPPERGYFELVCDGLTVPAMGSLFEGSRGVETRAPSTFLVRPSAEGRLELLRICLGCDDPGVDLELDEARRARTVELVLCVLAAFLMSWWRATRAPRLEDALRRAPARAEDRPTALSTARLVPLDGGAPIELDGPRWSLAGERPAPAIADDVPRLELPARDSPFREQPMTPARLVGPGRVNGLPVRRGAATTLRSGDIVSAKGRRFELQLDGETGDALRYHAASAPGRLRLVTAAEGLRPLRPALGYFALLAAIAVVGNAVLSGAWAVAAIASTGLLAVALTSPRRRLHSVDVDVSPAVDARIDDRERGGFVLTLAGRGDEALFVEHVPGWDGAGSPEERALRRALRSEAEEIVRRFRERQAGPSAR